MSARRSTVAGLVLLLGCLGFLVPASPAAPQEPTGASGQPARRALLIGVSTYPNLGEAFQLRGPVNDVEMFRRLLTERFGFPTTNVHTLSENSGEGRLPTRQNIEAEMRRLAEVVRPGDQVVVLLAGHGSLEPQAADARFPQPDGFDRIFLPRDVGKWDSARGGVSGAIRGEEIGDWLRPIADKGASLWVLVDSCHSGMGVRGTDVAREVDPEARGGLAIPHEAMLQAQEQGAQRMANLPEKARREADVKPLPSLNGVVVFYACQPAEQTIERRLPPKAADAKVYGLLAFTVAQVLTQADAPLTYLELAQRVHGHYAEMGRVSPTPLLEGRDRNREVLGLKEHPRRSLIRLSRENDTLTVTAGAIQGLTPNSVLAVYPLAGQKSERPLGYVRVTEVKTSSAEVEPCAFQGQPARADLAEGRCEVATLDYGDLKLRVGIDTLDSQGNVVPEADRRRLAERLAPLSARETSLVALTPEVAKAEWVLRLDSGKVYLVPGSGWPTSRPGRLPDLFGPYANDDELAAKIGERLERIARARNLLKLAGATPEEVDPAEQDDPPVQVKIELRLLQGSTDRKGQAVEWPNPSARFYNGDRVRFVIHNPNPYAIDVTLLDVAPDCGITCLFPLTGEGETSRILPKSARAVPTVRIDGKTSGPENLVVIAVKARPQEEPVDFSSLEQEGLEKAQDAERKRGVPQARGLGSPLGQLLQRSQFGVGTRTGREQVEETALLLYSWQFVAEKRP